MTNALVVVIFTYGGSNMNKKLLQRLLFFICSLITISVTFCGCSILSDDNETLGPPPNIKVQKNEYDLYKVVNKDIEKSIKGSATLISAKTAQLFFTDSGARIQSINVTEGQIVKKGTALITLNTDEISDNTKIQESEIKKIQMQLDTQKSLLEKYQSLPKDYQPSQKDINDLINNIKLIEIDLENANVTLNMLKRKMSQSVLSAPFDGVVTFIDSETKAGNNAEAYKRVVAVSDPNNLQLYYQVPKEHIYTIKTGMKAEITYKGTKYEGVVVMSPEDAPENASEKQLSTALISVKGLPEEVKFGATLDFKIILQSKSNVIVVPKRALKATYSGKTVQIMDGETKKLIPVETGLETDVDTEIISGLSVGQKVILN